MNKKQKTAKFLNECNILTRDEWMLHAKTLIKIGKIFSEQWICKFQLPDSPTVSEICYHTQWKNMHSTVEKRFKKDFPTAKLLTIIYQ